MTKPEIHVHQGKIHVCSVSLIPMGGGYCVYADLRGEASRRPDIHGVRRQVWFYSVCRT
jgi:hypothetical protein